MNKVLIIFVLLAHALHPLHAGKVAIVNLRTEYTETPLGMDVQRPRFSWQMQAGERGCGQSAYQITVAGEDGRQVWNSGKVASDISLNIEYAGAALEPCTRYRWAVDVWDNNNKLSAASSWFETGLMNRDPGLAAWEGARWIGGGDEDMPLYPQYLTVFRLSCSVQLSKETATTRAAFIYGANDRRLMDRNMNLYGLANSAGEAYLMVELDIEPLGAGDPAQIHVYRAGYHPQDRAEVALRSFAVPPRLVNSTNKYEAHTIRLSSVLGYTHIYLGEETGENQIGELNLNPLGQGGDFISFPVAGEIGFSVRPGQSARFAGVEVRNFRSPRACLFAPGEEYDISGGDDGTTVLVDPRGSSMPMLRTTFEAFPSAVTGARLYVTARGVYEIYMNGRRVGDDYFNPGLTQYNKTHLYQTYDVTDYLEPGLNALGAMLGEGWWSGAATYMGDNWNFFGDRQSLLAKLVITYADGGRQVVVSTPGGWKYGNDGALVYGSFFQGEVYDATKEYLVEGWDRAAFDDSGWKDAVEVSLPVADDYPALSLRGQFGPTVKKIRELTAVSVEEVRPGVYIYDMGQNMAGVPLITLDGMAAGREVVLRFAEVTYPDLPEYAGNTGMLMLENIRAAMAQDIYITRGGGRETINPRFTFHGYRFIEITGIDAPLPLDAVRSEVLSSVHGLASGYETSNAGVNKLWENITWSTYSNFLSIPTDCPQRNERLGWSGDISVFSRTATYLADVSQFLDRHLLAMNDVQQADGRYPDIAPLGGGFGGILWGSAGITVAWECYRQYDDRELLGHYYAGMKRYIDYLHRQIDGETNILGHRYRSNWGSLGDWLSPEYDKTDKSLLWEAYFLYDLELMQKIAGVLGKKEDAQQFGKCFAERKAFFNRTYIDPLTGMTVAPDGDKKAVDTQASYAIPLAFGLVDEALYAKVSERFAASVRRENVADNGVVCPPYSLMTGFIGTAWIGKALSDCGQTETVYRLLQQTTYPSWLYSVEQGATTIWERLNSYTHTNGFGGNNRMNSFNHYSFGAIGAWMYNHCLGIERDGDSAGFKRFVLRPEPDPTGEMRYARGHYDSMYGRIESGWQVDGNDYRYTFTIPANTSAVLYLRASSADDIREGRKPLARSKGVKYAGEHQGFFVFELPSGKYKITKTNIP